MDILRQLTNFRGPMDQPVGKAVAYGAGFGLSRGLRYILSRLTRIPAPAISAVLLALIAKMRVIQDTIGDDASELIATTAWIDAAEGTMGISERLEKLLLAGSGAASEAVADAADTGFFSFLNGPPLGQVAAPALPLAFNSGMTALERKIAAIK